MHLGYSPKSSKHTSNELGTFWSISQVLNLRYIEEHDDFIIA